MKTLHANAERTRTGLLALRVTLLVMIACVFYSATQIGWIRGSLFEAGATSSARPSR